MYYETKEGDEELRVLFLSTQVEEEDDEQPLPKKKTRRSEASMLNEENRSEQTRPKRAAATRQGQQRIDEFIAKKRSSTKTKRIELILPSMSIEQGERCPVCDRIIPDDILDVHRQACEIQTSDTAKQIVKKIQERTKIEAKVKETLFPRATRQTLTNQLTRNNSETSTCGQCGMQMTLHRLETQHKNECIADRRK